MEPKILLLLALVLSGGLFGCSKMLQHRAETVTRAPNLPSAEQVGQWAGLPATTHLNLATNVPREDLEEFGKLKWARTYEHREGRSLESFAIALYEPGTFFGTNRANAIRFVEQFVKTNKCTDEDFKLIADIQTLPNGRKTYAYPLGFSASRFSFHPDFDLLVIWSLDSRDDYPPEERIQRPTHPADNLYKLFKNVDAFLDTQPAPSAP